MDLNDYELKPVYARNALVERYDGDYYGQEVVCLEAEYDPSRWGDPNPDGYILVKKKEEI